MVISAEDMKKIFDLKISSHSWFVLIPLKKIHNFFYHILYFIQKFFTIFHRILIKQKRGIDRPHIPIEQDNFTKQGMLNSP